MSSIFQLKSLEFYIVPSKPAPDYEHRALHDRTYAFWRNLWEPIYKSLGVEHKFSPDDFSRHDLYSVLLAGDKVAAFQAHSFFDLRYQAHRDHHYIANYFSPTAMRAMSDRGAHRVMTMEYISAAAEFRAKLVGVSLATVIAGLAVHLGADRGVDANLGIGRMDFGVERIGKSFGGISLDEPMIINGVPSEPIGFFKDTVHEHRDAEISTLVKHFWSRRIDTTLPASVAAKAA